MRAGMRDIVLLCLPIAVILAAPSPSSAGCPSSGGVARDGWTLSFDYTPSDGLRVTDAAFQGSTVLTQSKLAEWHDDYGATGYVLATGCGPSNSYVIYPYGGAQVLDLPGSADGVAGFELVADYRDPNWGQSCNYRFEQRYQFFEDGSFRVAAGAFGKGCGANETFRPLLRIDLAAGGSAASDRFALWSGSAWAVETTEFLRTPYAGLNGPLLTDPEGRAGRILDAVSGAGYFLEPGVGGVGLPGQDDEPFLYVVRHHPNEGDGDLGALGTCCNDDENQGPEAFVQLESINSQDIVVWYVPQMQTDSTPPDYSCWTVTGEPNPETYPCYAGPIFRPTPRVFADGFEIGTVGRWSAVVD